MTKQEENLIGGRRSKEYRNIKIDNLKIKRKKWIGGKINGRRVGLGDH